jgi:hypothetical protein
VTELGKAPKKNLKVGAGLMVCDCRGRQALLERIRGGQIGDINAMRAYRMGRAGGTAPRKPDGLSEVMYQVQRRRVQRLQHPPDRRVLLDEGVVAG